MSLELRRRFCDYDLLNVYQDTTPEMREEVIAMWRRNNILPAGVDPAERAKQIALIVTDPDSNIVGVTTAYKDIYPFHPTSERPQKPYYFFRFFLDRAGRVPELYKIMANETFAMLRDREKRLAGQSANPPVGMAIITENRKLMRPGMKQKFRRNGYVLVADDGYGHDVYLRHFRENEEAF